MRASAFLVCTLLATLVALVGCATTAAGQASVEVSCDDFATRNEIESEVGINAGETLQVSLCANPTTGFVWEDAEIANPDILQQVERRFVAPTGDRAGAPGSEVWTFKGLAKGTTSVSMGYSRPWEGGEKGQWRFNLTVTVR